MASCAKHYAACPVTHFLGSAFGGVPAILSVGAFSGYDDPIVSNLTGYGRWMFLYFLRDFFECLVGIEPGFDRYPV